MAANLKTRAVAQRDNSAAAEAAARAQLDLEQTQRRRVGDPAQPIGQWRTLMGAEQYLAEAVGRDRRLQEEEKAIRARLAAIPTPANHIALVAELTANLVAQTATRVLRRDAQELDAISSGAIAQLSSAVQAAAADRAEAEAWLAEADALQQAIDADRATLAAVPVSRVPADAAALKAGAAMTAARDRLGGLLPQALADRAADRFDEAQDIVANVAKVFAAAQAERDDLERARCPVDADVEIASRALAAAQAALRDYMAVSVDQLARARTVLADVAALVDVSPDEQVALDPTVPERHDALDALGLEHTFAEKWQAHRAKDVAVQIAVLDALKEDPDADPNAAAAVVTAVADRDAAPKTDLEAATTAYSPALEDALDAWEREVPNRLWDAARDLRQVTRVLDRLADGATRTDLVAQLDAAIDQVADARDERAVLRRATLRMNRELSLQSVRTDAVARSSTAREMAFVRGDGRGGRHGDES